MSIRTLGCALAAAATCAATTLASAGEIHGRVLVDGKPDPTVVAFWRVSRGAAALLLPYLAWVGFAAALNRAIWRLN